MEELIIYLIKSTGLMSIFYLAYLVLLRKDTSFEINRKFLFWGILASLVLPFLEFTRTVFIDPGLGTTSIPIVSEPSAVPAPVQEFSFDWWTIFGVVYFTGFAILTLRFVVQLLSLWKSIGNQPKTRKGRFIMVSSGKITKPFSFFRYIVFNAQVHSPEELELIVQHEEIHARQWHTADVLVAHMASILLWFNPLSWLYKSSLIQNLEFIADKETVAVSGAKRKYQHTLVKISVAGYAPALANPFYQSFIKKRISMLNKKPSGSNSFWKVSLVFPFLLAFLFFFNVKTEAQVITSKGTSTEVQSDLEISITITKEAKESSWEAYKRIFKKQGVDLEFSNIKRSSEGLLTGITISFTNTKTGQTGNLSRNNPAGIEAFTFYVKGNTTGFKDAPSLGTTENSGADLLNKIGTAPLYIIGSKEYEAAALYGKYIHIKGSIEGLDAEEGKRKFGRRAKDGAVIIPEGEVVTDIDAAMKALDDVKEEITRQYLHVKEGERPYLISAHKKAETKSSSRENEESNDSKRREKAEDTLSFEENWQESILESDSDTNASQYSNMEAIYESALNNRQPLFVVDGEVQEKNFSIHSIDPNKIESINVLKEKNATEKYGQKGKYGAVEISLKKKENDKVGDSRKEAPDSTPQQDRNTLFTATNVQFSPTIGEDSLGKKRKAIMIISDSDTPEPPKAALYLLNGKVVDSATVKALDSKRIASVKVSKGTSAIEKYGQRAEEGAIEIVTIKGGE